jgi:hypothetical protein
MLQKPDIKPYSEPDKRIPHTRILFLLRPIILQVVFCRQVSWFSWPSHSYDTIRLYTI